MTKDTEKAFKIIYCEYKRLRKAGYSKKDAMEFNGNSVYKIPAFSKWLRPDIDCALEELIEPKYLKEDVTGDISITSDGIEYMENKPKEFFNDLSGLFDIVGLFL